MLAGRQAEHFKRQKFEGTQKFSAAVDEERRVGAGEVDEDFGLLPVAVLRKRRIDDDPVFEAESTVSNDGGEKFVDLVGGGEFVGNGHWWLSAFSF